MVAVLDASSAASIYPGSIPARNRGQELVGWLKTERAVGHARHDGILILAFDRSKESRSIARRPEHRHWP